LVAPVVAPTPRVVARGGGDDDGGLLPLPLIDAEKYRHVSPGVCDACASDANIRAAWAQLLIDQIPAHQVQARRSEQANVGGVTYEAYERFEQAYHSWLEDMKQPDWHPASGEAPTLLWMVREKERLVREYGCGDVFAAMKDEEGQVALALYPELCAELDGKSELALSPDGVPAVLELALACCLAGNLFDAGAAWLIASEANCVDDECEVDLDSDGEPGLLLNNAKVADTFRAARAFCERDGGWHYDDAAALSSRLTAKDGSGRPIRRAVVFCDNAGADTMGMVLLARTILQMMGDDAMVALTANSSPALNDVTFAELEAFVDEARRADAVVDDMLQSGRLVLLPSGQDSTLLDLGSISNELHAWVTSELDIVTSHDEWLIVLDGMGRSLESNFQAYEYVTQGTSVLTLAMIKSEINARRLEANVKDCVVRLRTGERQLKNTS